MSIYPRFMKKLLLFFALLVLGFSTQAQSQVVVPLSSGLTQELLRSTVALLVMSILAGFILRLLKLVLDHRLKRQVLEVGAPDTVVAQLLPTRQAPHAAVLKWVFLLTASGLGLTVAYNQQPWGVPSIIILLFSLALGFLGYYLALQRIAN